MLRHINSLTSPGIDRNAGTPIYMPIECHDLEGGGGWDASRDIYAWGLILCEMVLRDSPPAWNDHLDYVSRAWAGSTDADLKQLMKDCTQVGQASTADRRADPGPWTLFRTLDLCIPTSTVVASTATTEYCTCTPLYSVCVVDGKYGGNPIFHPVPTSPLPFSTRDARGRAPIGASAVRASTSLRLLVSRFRLFVCAQCDT